jgi:hypothetical protein
MYDLGRLVRRGTGAIGRIVLAAAVLIAFFPVAQAYAPPVYGGLYGYVDASGSSTPLAGIRVQAFRNGGGGVFTPGPITYTDTNGEYGLAVLGGYDYRVLFSDTAANPNQLYADVGYKASGSPGYVEMSDDILVAGGSWNPAGAQMHPASRIVASVTRSGQYATPLKGMVVSILCYAGATATRAYATDAHGTVDRGGVTGGSYRVTISDPSGKFGTVVLPTASTYHGLLNNDEWIVNASLPLVNASTNIAVSTPSCASSVKHNAKLAVSGTLSKRAVGLTTMRLDAYQYSPGAMAWVLNKQATLKIAKSGTKSKYSGSIKLPNARSRWRLVAVFPGSSQWAQSGSTFKSVKVN